MWYTKEILSQDGIHFVVEGVRTDESISIVLSLYESDNHFQITEFIKIFKPSQLENITNTDIYNKFADKAIKLSNKLSNKNLSELLEYFQSKRK